MKNIENKQIEFFFKDCHVGTLFDKDESGLFTYCSDINGEREAKIKYFLPKLYEDELLGSVEKKAEGFAFVESICLKLNRPDLIESLGITENDSEFDMLYKLAQQGEFVGENFIFHVQRKLEKAAEPCPQ